MTRPIQGRRAGVVTTNAIVCALTLCRLRTARAARAMKAGAVEFLTKPFKDDVLLDAIRGAVERSRAAVRLESEMRALRNRYDSLTPREREVMA